jgi:hypothetical protein
MPIEISVQSNIERVRARLTDFQAKQLPYATARALTKSVFRMQKFEAPASMRRDMVAPLKFTLGGLRYKGATKTNQRATVFIEQKRLKYLRHTATGEDREPHTFPYVMVPVGLERQSGTGRVLSGRMARNYRTLLLSKKDHFEGQIRSTRGIWQRVGGVGPRGGGGRSVRLVVLYLARTSYQLTWRFHETLAGKARRIFDEELGDALRIALATARPT